MDRDEEAATSSGQSTAQGTVVPPPSYLSMVNNSLDSWLRTPVEMVTASPHAAYVAEMGRQVQQYVGQTVMAETHVSKLRKWSSDVQRRARQSCDNLIAVGSPVVRHLSMSHAEPGSTPYAAAASAAGAPATSAGMNTAPMTPAHVAPDQQVQPASPSLLQWMWPINSIFGGRRSSQGTAEERTESASLDRSLQEAGQSGPSSGAILAADVAGAEVATANGAQPTGLISRMLSRINTTLKGSQADIGWLKREPGFPPATDGTERFLQHLTRVCNGNHTLPNSLIYLLVPGLFSNIGSLYFTSTKKHLTKLGLTCHIAKIHSEASVETNAAELRAYVEELHWGSGGKKVAILGHSKGGVDAAAALALYPDALKDKIAGIALVQSPYGGTPAASDIMRKGQLADAEARALINIFLSRLFKGDLRCLEDITYERRREFLLAHPLPSGIPIVSFHTEASKNLADMAAISHVHMADIPVPSTLPQGASRAIPGLEAAVEAGAATVSLPLPATAMLAFIAWHMELRYGAKSDGLVTRDDAEVPGSIAVRPVKQMDHAWPVYATAPLLSFGGRTEQRGGGMEVTAPLLCEALYNLLLEGSEGGNSGET